MVVKKEVGNFCQTTSLKGLPRAFKAEHKGTRVAWTLAVILMLTMACYQVTMLVLEYLDYPTYTVSHEHTFHPIDDQPVLPTLTLCNENPFSTLKPPVNSYGLPTVEEYYSIIDALTQCVNCSVEQLYQTSLIKTLMRNPNAYFQNLGSKYSKLVGHDLDHFILSCREIVFLGMTFLEKTCSEIISIELSQSADYFNCYRVTLPFDYDMEQWGMIAGVSLVLYLDNVASMAESFNISQLLENTFPISKYGAVVIPTHHQGSAFPALDGIQIPAGMSSKIQFSIDKEQRLEPPWGKCQPTDVEGYEFIKMCISDCFQDIIQNSCRCTDTRMVKQLDDELYPFCLKIAGDPTQASKNFVCATDQLRTDAVTQCMKECPTMCREYGYKTELSFSNWPNPLNMKNFYKTYIAGKDFEKHFAIVNQVIDGNCTGDIDCMMKYIMAQKLLEHNFLEVKFHLSDIRYMYTEEKKKIGVADFFSKLGGALNLWAGITVVILFEMVELLCKIVMHKLQTRSNDKCTKEMIDSEEKKNETIKVESMEEYGQEDNGRFNHLDEGFQRKEKEGYLTTTNMDNQINKNTFFHRMQ